MLKGYIRSYSGLLVRHTKKSMQRVALCIDLSEIFERYKAKVQARMQPNPRQRQELVLNIHASISPFPELTIRNKIKAFEIASDIDIELYDFWNTGTTTSNSF